VQVGRLTKHDVENQHVAKQKSKSSVFAIIAETLGNFLFHIATPFRVARTDRPLDFLVKSR
jgi:hypothetical protein